MKVALWSNYPEKLIRKIEAKLKERGIFIVKVLSGKSNHLDLSGVDYVLAMHELASHKEYVRLVANAKSDKKKVILMSRKVSAWDRDLQQILRETNAPAR